jgi:hypothetical protein
MTTIAPTYRFTPTFYDHVDAYTLTHTHTDLRLHFMTTIALNTYTPINAYML